MVPTIKGHPTTGCSHDGRALEGNSKYAGGLGEIYRSSNKKFGLPKLTIGNEGPNFDNFPSL
jgi:hypothetical protein